MRTHLRSMMCIGAALACLAAGEGRARAATAPGGALPPDTPGAAEAPASKAIAPEIGAGVGLDIATSGLGVGPAPFIEGGVRVLLGPGSAAAALRIGFETFSTSGTGALPCAPEGGSPCVESGGGSYEWSLNEQALVFGLPLSYRFLPPDRLLVPYVMVVPQLYLLKATVTAYGLENTQGDTRLGVSLIAGGQLSLGPGAAFLDVGYQYAGLGHRLTGDSNLGAVVTALGYRVAL